MIYKMIDLGYKRTPAKDMVLEVTFSNGETWRVSAQVIADDRDKHYANEEEDTLGQGNCSYDIPDWASNNMNWSDLAPYAWLLPAEKKPFDYDADWVYADKDIHRR